MTYLPYIDVETVLPLVRYAQLVGLDIAHILQVGGNAYEAAEGLPICSYCWDDTKRLILKSCISTAEQMIAEQLGFPVGATYIHETARFPWHWTWSPRRATMIRQQRGRLGWPILRSKWKRVLTLGQVQLSELTGTFTWSCPHPTIAGNPDMVGTYVIADPDNEIDLSRIRVFHANPQVPIVPLYEIRGLRIRRNNDNIELEGFRPLWVTPDACGFTGCVDYETDANFTTDETYLFVAEEEDLAWEAICYHWTVDECGTACTTTEQRACGNLINPDLGHIQAYPASWDGATTIVPATPDRQYPPDYYTLRYRAGYQEALRNPLFHNYPTAHNMDRMGARMARAIVHLTNHLLPEDARCGCSEAQKLWARDSSIVGASTPTYSRPSIPISDRCPFGETYGALSAWRLVYPLRSGAAGAGGVAVT